MLFAHAYIRNEIVQGIRETSVQMELALQQANAANKAKSAFLSNMSHEMRTPMNAIIGMAAIGKKAKSLERKDYALGKIGGASSHLLGVISDVLDMAKIEANKMELAPVEYDFSKMLERVIGVVHFRVEEKDQLLTVDVDDNIPDFIFGDDQRLAQVITNLLSNAVKFTPHGGKIKLAACLAEGAGDGCLLRFEITDSGIGISPEQSERLFQAFEQAESGISREYGGTGLGLVISKQIVELMGGDIWAESELGRGAKFVFTANALRCEKGDAHTSRRCADKGKSADGDDAASAVSFEGKKMLVVEDFEINREIIVALLEDTGLDIDCAENGKEALDMLQIAPEKYDVVLMDVQMPLMDGLEATRRIRALPSNPVARLPIIAMTANVFEDDITACLEAGMDDHLSKPLELDRVMQLLRKHLVA